jgi:hypothetical protein
MIAFDQSTKAEGEHFYCAFAGRRDGKPFLYDHDALMAKYSAEMKTWERVPDALAGSMGNQMYLANFKTEEEMWAFYNDAVAEKSN